MRSRHRVGRPYRVARQQMFALYGTVCHLCGHEGAGESDHLDPVSRNPDQPIDPYLMRPAHGANAPGPTCGRKCNTERGNKPLSGPLRTSESW